MIIGDVIHDGIFVVAGAVAAVAIPAVFKFVAKQLGWVEAKASTVSVASVEAAAKSAYAAAEQKVVSAAKTVDADVKKVV